jgi:hypothetical protein
MVVALRAYRKAVADLNPAAAFFIGNRDGAEHAYHTLQRISPSNIVWTTDTTPSTPNRAPASVSISCSRSGPRGRRQRLPDVRGTAVLPPRPPPVGHCARDGRHTALVEDRPVLPKSKPKTTDIKRTTIPERSKAASKTEPCRLSAFGGLRKALNSVGCEI